MIVMKNKTLHICCVLLLCIMAKAAFANDYQILPGDILTISVWKEEDLEREVLVGPEGSISFPLAGSIVAMGKTSDEVTEELAGKLEKYIPEPEVNVAVLQAQGNRAYVIGKVARPGPVLMSQGLDVMQALSVAGGTTTFAKLSQIKILRRDASGTEEAIPFNYKKVQKGEDLQTNIILKQGDVVVVP